MLSLTVGKELEGRYVVEGLLGSGGYGSVWRAADKQLGRTVALKRLLRTGTAFGPTDLQRLLAEARKHAQLVHTNIVQVYDVIECDGEQLIVMEFVDGPSLLELLRQQVLAGTILPLDRAISVLRDILSGLTAVQDNPEPFSLY